MVCCYKEQKTKKQQGQQTGGTPVRCTRWHRTRSASTTTETRVLPCFRDNTGAVVPVLLVTSSSHLPQVSCAYKYLSRFSEKGRLEKRALRIALARFSLVFLIISSSSSNLVQSLKRKKVCTSCIWRWQSYTSNTSPSTFHYFVFLLAFYLALV